MLKLPAVSSDDMLDSFQNVRAKFKPIGTEWIFEDIHNDDDDEDDDDDNNNNNNNNDNEEKSKQEQDENTNKDKIDDDEEKSSKFLHAPIKSIFDHFDKNNDGKLEENDINDLHKASKYELDRSIFINSTPMRYPQFEQCWKEISPGAAQNILEYISVHMKNQVIISYF